MIKKKEMPFLQVTDLKSVKWGSYGAIHIISIILVFAVIAALYFILKNKTDGTQRLVLFILSLWGPAAIIYNLTVWNTPLEYLPLHLCSLNAILIPAAIATKSKIIGNILPLMSVGALAAILFNGEASGYGLFSWVFLMYYVPHLFEFAIPVLLILLGKVNLEKKYIPFTALFMFASYTAVHFINISLNKYFAANGIVNYLGKTVWVNYMYTVSTEGNPALCFFWNLLPRSYFYLLTALPLVLIICFTMCELCKLVHKPEKAKKRPAH